ncbi:GNAT family N-acetyltransferase [Paenibacillus cymbidii]|uniref:GNAT family N-acetyltransferase n=1 Tax=Paenibacillus cymbidii TaxID=1639034 RepID=UPI001080F95E|nr:GNAT family N-acetyltransferase [Paenibacillus cymbidii]
MHEITIGKVNQLDSNRLMLLVDESVNEGFLHIRRLVNDFDAGTNKFDQDGEALFAAYQNDEIVGICGLNRDPYSNSQEIGRVRRLYVSPKVRRFGIGRMLVDAVVEEAKTHYRTLVLRTNNPIADIFYRSIGFSRQLESENATHFFRLKD